MKEIDPWAQYRKRNGEFRYWLHEFWYRPSVMFTQTDGPGFFRYHWELQSHALPWIFPRSPRIDGQELKAFYNMGYFKSAPEPWAQWVPADDVLADLANQSIYGVILDRQSESALRNWTAVAEKQCGKTGRTFKQHVLDKHVLFAATT